MKKKWIAVVSIMMAVSLLAAGCGSSGSSEQAVAPQQKLTMVTGGTGGTYYALGGAMASFWNKKLDNISVTSIASNASVENINHLNTGENDLGLAMNSIADAAWNGDNPFSTPNKNFRTIGVIYPEVYQLVAAASSGATTLTDLAGQKVAIGPAGSGSAVASEIAFSAAGMDINNDLSAERDGFADATSKMQDGHLVASAGVLSVPASSIVELETSMSLNFIHISDEELAAIQKNYPFYSRYVIPAGTYSNTEAVNTITCQAALYCKADLDEDTVYEITKALYEYSQEIADTHDAGKYISKDTALDGITTPIHKGAARYYKEIGIDVPKDLIVD